MRNPFHCIGKLLENRSISHKYAAISKRKKYDSPDEFVADVQQMFDNCKTFNEDSSQIGQGGETLRKWWTKRWRQLKYNFSKRYKRMIDP